MATTFVCKTCGNVFGTQGLLDAHPCVAPAPSSPTPSSKIINDELYLQARQKELEAEELKAKAAENLKKQANDKQKVVDELKSNGIQFLKESEDFVYVEPTSAASTIDALQYCISSKKLEFWFSQNRAPGHVSLFFKKAITQRVKKP